MNSSPNHDATDFDSLEPDDIDPLLQRQEIASLLHQLDSSNRQTVRVRTHELGELIVNSVTMYDSSFMDMGEAEGTVAIVT